MTRKVHLDRGNGAPWCFVRAKAYAFGDDAAANCELCFKLREMAPGPNQKLVCCRCQKKKPGAEFQENAGRATGKTAYCAECKNRDERSDRRARPEVYAAKSRLARLRNPEPSRRAARRSSENKPKAARARDIVRRAIRDGVLIRGRCEGCCSKLAVAHHDDYDKPLDVRWLCRRHHSAWHEANGPGANLTDSLQRAARAVQG